MINFEFSSIMTKLRNTFPFNKLQCRRYWQRRKGFGIKNTALESSAIQGCKFNTVDFLKEYHPKEWHKLQRSPSNVCCWVCSAYLIILTTLCPFSKCSYTLIWNGSNDSLYLNEWVPCTKQTLNKSWLTEGICIHVILVKGIWLQKLSSKEFLYAAVWNQD